jgi:hypothetical protein
MPRGWLHRETSLVSGLVLPPKSVTHPAALSLSTARVRHLWLGVASALAAYALTASGCGTEAIGVDACRDIELARCDAAQYCGTIDDVAACRRFYRDHCLHGLRTGIDPVPTDDQVSACVATIKSAGSCAKGDRNARLEECDSDITLDDGGATHACDLVLFPEWAIECSFLGPKGDLPPHPGDGGQGGQGGAG